MKSNGNRRLGLAVAALALGLTLTGCAEEGGASSGGGEGVELGADKQTYVDALADMEPVELVMQSTAPQGAATGRRFEEYAAAVEDWSGGKITFDIAFSNAIAPVDQVDDAIADSRIDIGSVIVALEPSKFPVTNLLWDLSFIGSQQPVEGLLEWHGTMIETAEKTAAIQEEYEANGLHVLLPAFSSGSYFLNCAEPGEDLADFKGRAIASQSRVQNTEVEAIGMAPSTVTYAEMFESLERGVVDCAASTMTTSSLGGFIPGAPYFAFSPEEGLASPGGSITIGLDRWNSLPLAAQQLLYDRLDVLLEANFAATWENIDAGLTAMQDENGEVIEVSDDVTAAITSANEDALAEAASSSALDDAQSFVDDLVASEEAWATKVSGLGIDGVDVDYAGFQDWHAGDAPDLTAYFEELAQSMSVNRPS